MPDFRSIEQFIYGPDADRSQGLVGSLPDILKKAQKEGIKTIEIEIRKTPPGAPSTQEGTERIGTDKGEEDIAAALLRRLQDAPSDSFKGELRLNFREAGNTRNVLGSFTRQMSGGGASSPTSPDGGWVPYEKYHAALEDNRRTMDAGIRIMNAGANLIEKHMTFVQNLVNPAQNSKSPDLLTKTLGVVAMGLQDPAKGAAEAAKVLESESKPIPAFSGSSGSSSSSSSSSSSGSSGAKPPYEFGEEDAERWARANPDKARAMALKLMQEGAT